MAVAFGKHPRGAAPQSDLSRILGNRGIPWRGQGSGGGRGHIRAKFSCGRPKVSGQHQNACDERAGRLVHSEFSKRSRRFPRHGMGMAPLCVLEVRALDVF